MKTFNKFSSPNDFNICFNISNMHNSSFAFRSRKRSKKDGNKKEDGTHTNEVFDYNNELTENPLYITSESAEETENIPGEQHELGLPNNKPIDPMSVYAAPNKNRNHHQMTSSGDVYAQVYK